MADDTPPLLLPAPAPEDQGQKVYPPPPEGIRVLANGSGVDGLGRFRYPPGTFGPGQSPITTSAQASALAHRRHEIHARRRQEAIIAAVAEALDQPQDGAAREGFRKAIAKADADTFRVLWRDVVLGPSGKLRDRVMAYIRLGQAAGLPGLSEVRGREDDGVTVSVSISGKALGALVGLVGDRLGRDEGA